MVNEPLSQRPDQGGFLELAWIPILAGAFAVLVAVGAMFVLTGERAQSPDSRAELFSEIGGEFTLTGHTGAPVSLSDFHGQIVLVYFGYTYCPDVCPIHLTLISAALDRMGRRARDIQPLFVTVDPARDTPEAMARYVDYFAASLIGLSGSETEIDDVATQYAVARQIVGDTAADDYTVDHSSVIYVIGREGQIIDLLNTEQTPDELAAQLQRLL